MPIPSGVEQKKSKVYVQKHEGEYIQIWPEGFCESELVEGSIWPVSSDALKHYSDSIEERIAPFAGATANKVGKIGTVPEAKTSDRTNFLRGDGKWVQIITTDEKVKAIHNDAKKFYITGTDVNDTNVGVSYFDSGVFVSENSGDLHAVKFTGNLEGNVRGDLEGTASKAFADGNGRNIVNTYATTEALRAGYSPLGHKHTALEVNALTGYSKGSSTAAISASDTLNQALGKLEKKLDGVATLNSPAFTGIPTTPNIGSNSIDTQIANKKYVDDKITALIGGAGSAFDTLNELKLALDSDSDFAGTMTTKLSQKIDKTSANYVKTITISDNTAGSGQILKLQRGDDTTYTLNIKDTVIQPGTIEPKKATANPTCGTSLKYAREDHVHPLQDTTVSNANHAVQADKANKLTNARKLRANLAATADATFDGSADQLNIPVTGVLPVANGGTGAANLNGLVQTGNVNQTIGGTKTFSNTISGSINGNAATATTASKVQGTLGTSWVVGAQAGKALVNATNTGYGAIFNAPTKDYRVALGTYPSNDNIVYLYSVTNANVNAGTNTKAKQVTWNAETGELTATSFTGTLNGASTSCTGNAATASKLGTATVGGAAKPIYLSSGAATALTATVGTASKPVYLNAGTITACSSTVGGTAKPIYLSNGTATALTATVGTVSKPVFLSSGTITACSSTVGSTSKPVYMNAGTISACTATVGSASVPVYLNAGTITQCTGVATNKVYKGATSSAAGVVGLVPSATSAQYLNFFRADGTWQNINFTDAVAMGSSETAINLSKGCVFTKTISANTTFTITGVPSGKSAIFNLVIVNGGSKTIAWPSSVKWADRTPPSLSSSGKDLLTFLTPDGGTTWFGMAAVLGAA